MLYVCLNTFGDDVQHYTKGSIYSVNRYSNKNIKEIHPVALRRELDIDNLVLDCTKQIILHEYIGLRKGTPNEDSMEDRFTPGIYYAEIYEDNRSYMFNSYNVVDHVKFKNFRVRVILVALNEKYNIEKYQQDNLVNLFTTTNDNQHLVANISVSETDYSHSYTFVEPSVNRLEVYRVYQNLLTKLIRNEKAKENTIKLDDIVCIGDATRAITTASNNKLKFDVLPKDLALRYAYGFIPDVNDVYCVISMFDSENGNEKYAVITQALRCIDKDRDFEPSDKTPVYIINVKGLKKYGN